MSLTITLNDTLVARLENKAKKQQLSVEQVALTILTDAMASDESLTPQEAVTRIQSTAPNPSNVRVATANLADLLRGVPNEVGFDLESWNRQWSAVEAEMKAITRANDMAGRMANYLMDTNHAAALVTLSHPLRQRVLSHLQARDTFAITVLVVAETLYGIGLLPRAGQNLAEWTRLRPSLACYTSDEADAENAAALCNDPFGVKVGGSKRWTPLSRLSLFVTILY